MNTIEREYFDSILLIASIKSGNGKIADFGIAKMVTNQTMVYSKAVMGSVHYISPEQASGGK